MPRDITGSFTGKFQPDHREFDPRRCCRIYFDAYDGTSLAGLSASIRHANVYRNNNATISSTNNYGDTVGNYLSIKSAASTAASRSWVSERVIAVQNALMAGYAEMDVQAMVRIPSFAIGVGANVGFFSAHSTPGDGMYNQLAFECYNASVKAKTWFACSSAWDANAAASVTVRIDTGVPVNDWNVLRVWINRDATAAVWTINNVVVREERNKLLFPTWENQLLRGETNPNIVAAANGMQAGCRTRADDSAANEECQLDVNWMLYRYFREYA